MSKYKPILAGLVTTAAFVMFCTATPSQAVVGCNNDGNVQNGEICDNGPSIIADGCDDNCQVLTGWECVNPGGSGPSVCDLIVCGNGITQTGEDCDGEACCNEDCTFTAADTVCRESAGACDLAEECTGADADCPVNDHVANGVVCRPAVSLACDVDEVCDGASDDCPTDVLANGCDDQDGLACTESTCTSNGDCVHADTCVEICRGPGFWQNHSGEEKVPDLNIGQSVLDETGGISVCGNYIYKTDDLGDLDSALEGLCVRTQGSDVRQLYRQLITARLNCAISEGLDCEQITSRFIDVSYNECDALCAGDPVQDGPTAEECEHALACFNKGGVYSNGDCVIGTCNDDGVTDCGSDEDCDEGIECVRPADSCANSELCSTDLTDAEAQICPQHGPATSPKTCRDARRNTCNVDSNGCAASCEFFDNCEAACQATPGCKVAEACSDQDTCLYGCFNGAFGGICDCEFAHAEWCYAETSGVQPDFFNCLLNYELDADNGFCIFCTPDISQCLP